jgi:hypothetical protein
MIAKYDIDYIIQPEHNHRVDTHRSNDPIEVEDFLLNLLATGSRVVAIKHEGIALGSQQSDRLLKVAADRLASRCLCRALAADSADVKHRFGYAA